MVGWKNWMVGILLDRGPTSTFDVRHSMIMFRVLMCIEALKCRMLNVEVLPKPAACRLKLPPDDPGVGTYLVVEPSDAEQQGENPPTDHPETMSAAQLQAKWLKITLAVLKAMTRQTTGLWAAAHSSWVRRNCGGGASTWVR